MHSKPEKKTIAKNKVARFEYEVLETLEAGIELTGCEVRSLRERRCQITESFCLIRRGEAWLHGVHIHPYSHGSIFNQDPDRKRRLLLHKNQIAYLAKKVQEKGMALVPLEMYFNKDNRVKLLVGLCKGKKLHDKRQDMAKRDTQREIQRTLKMVNQKY